MTFNPFQQPPYFDWRLDRWKIAVVIVLFLLLLAWWLGWFGLAPPTALILTPTGIAASPAPNHLTATAAVEGQTPPPAAEKKTAEVGVTVATVTPRPSVQPLALTLANLAPNSTIRAGTISVLVGTAAPHSQIRVTDRYQPESLLGQPMDPSTPETPLGAARADQDGRWYLDLGDPLALGRHQIFVRQLADDGRVQALVGPVTVTVLAEESALPTFTTPTISLPAAGAQLLNSTPTFIGTAAPNSLLRLHLNDQPMAEIRANEQGEWRLTLDAPLPSGSYVAQVMVVDGTGAVVAASSPVALAVLEGAIPQAAPTLVVVGGAALPLKNSTPVFMGTASANVAVEIAVAGVAHVVQADARGRWLYAQETPLSVGLAWITARVVDLEGRPQTEAAVLIVNIAPDARPVARPSITIADFSEPLADSTPTLSGTADPGVTVYLYDGEELLAAVEVDEEDRWQWTPKVALASGEHELWAAVVDESERMLSRSSPWSIVIAPHAQPSPPPVVQPTEGTPVSAAGPTATVTPQPKLTPAVVQAPVISVITAISGTAMPGARLFVYIDGEFVGETKADVDGHWRFVLPEPVPSAPGHNIQVVQVDEAGRPVAVTTPPTVVPETTTVPVKQPFQLLSPVAGVVRNRLMPISGLSAPHSRIAVWVDGRLATTVDADALGRWYTVPPVSLRPGTHTVQVRSSTGEISQPITVQIRPGTPAIAAPGILSPAANQLLTTGLPAVSGVAQPGQWVTVFVGSTAVGRAVADGWGNWSYQLKEPLSVGPHDLSARILDADGALLAASAVTPVVVAANAESVAEPP